ncbi:MAG: thioesterase [Acidimicrobiia bacterium]|nr:thioesterase [Acidimicrobiia bacterium]
MEDGGVELGPEPALGRVFSARRLVRFGDPSPGGRLRLDAVARYLQDVSGDDTADAGFGDVAPWVVRRQTIEVWASARFREELTLRTWCSGTGSRWAERRVGVTGADGARLEAVAPRVHVDPGTGRPRPLGDEFFACYGEAARERRVRARLRHDPTVPADAAIRPWSLRFTDFDPLRHVNNAACLSMVEEELAGRRDLRPPFRVEVEYRVGIVPGTEVDVAVTTGDGPLALWVVDRADGTVFATAAVSPVGEDGPARGR